MPGRHAVGVSLLPALTALAIAACGSSDDGANLASTSVTPTITATAATQPAPVVTAAPATPTPEPVVEPAPPEVPPTEVPAPTQAPAPPAPISQPSGALPTATLVPPPAPPPPPIVSGPPPPVSINVSGKNLQFSTKQFSARSGAAVTVTFVNEDVSVAHDISFSIPGLGHGHTCTGPCTDTYSFTAPAPGAYQFFCTLHADMVGTFSVAP